MANIIIEIPFECDIVKLQAVAKKLEYNKTYGIKLKYGDSFTAYRGRAKCGEYERMQVMSAIQNAWFCE